jgi:hypothetical protein
MAQSSPGTWLRLSYVAEYVDRNRVIQPAPRPRFYIRLIERGDLIGRKERFGHLVSEESFREWLARYGFTYQASRN